MSRFRCVVLILAALLFGPALAQAAHELQAGVAVVDITPPIPFRMHGYFYERLSTGVKDPLHARAIVLQQGQESAAFVFCDLVGIPSTETLPARKKASEATGIPIEHISITGTHTHTGPQFFMSINDFWHAEAVAKFGKDPYDCAEYQRTLVEKIAGAIVQAKAALAPVELQAGMAREDRIRLCRARISSNRPGRSIHRWELSRLRRLARRSPRPQLFRSRCIQTLRAAARCTRRTIFIFSISG